jgi:2-polyprenyl-3-methyl-5-hydroxy-6-metoxy-1,4-benzoquinol methylase
MQPDVNPKFDAYASSYESLHNASISASGEGPAYFAEYKVNCLLREGLPSSARILDYGCGIGNVLVPLGQAFRTIHGFDPSTESLRVARERAPAAVLHSDITAVPNGFFEAVVLSGVLHHVPPAERSATIDQAVEKLSPGGKLFVFEHNPFNPLTRRAVATCPFDDDAILLWPWQARATLERGRLDAIRLDYIVFFPKPLAFLRKLEPHLDWLPIGAQMMVVGTRPIR